MLGSHIFKERGPVMSNTWINLIHWQESAGTFIYKLRLPLQIQWLSKRGLWAEGNQGHAIVHSLQAPGFPLSFLEGQASSDVLPPPPVPLKGLGTWLIKQKLPGDLKLKAALILSGVKWYCGKHSYFSKRDIQKNLREWMYLGGDSEYRSGAGARALA